MRIDQQNASSQKIFLSTLIPSVQWIVHFHTVLGKPHHKLLLQFLHSSLANCKTMMARNEPQNNYHLFRSCEWAILDILKVLSNLILPWPVGLALVTSLLKNDPLSSFEGDK